MCVPPAPPPRPCRALNLAKMATNASDVGSTAYTVRYGICSAPPNAVTTSVSFSASRIPPGRVPPQWSGVRGQGSGVGNQGSRVKGWGLGVRGQLWVVS